MKALLHRAILAALGLTACSAPAQMHKVAKPQQVVRAVGVYEWTGDLSKPNASRLIPVSLYIDGQLQDAGIYLARPVPFALLSGNVYELQSAGLDKGLLDLVYARHLQATDASGDLAYDDGWFGYGKVQPLASPRRTSTALKPSKNIPVLQSSIKDTAAKPDANTTADPDRPTMKRRGDSSNSSASSTGSPSSTSTASTPSDDPDRPTMKRRDPSSNPDPDTASTTSKTSKTSDPATDPDRPTLKRRTPEEARKVHNANDGPSTTGYNSLNEDPNRPTLHYGKATHALTETDLPKLTGLPQNLHQLVAVSDAVSRDPHPFALDWEDPAQHASVLQKLQALAQAQLAGYKFNTPAASAPVQKRAVSAARARHPAKPASPPPISLMDEELKAYTLSYGGDPTYIYSAHTAGTGAGLRYVTIVAQSDSLGQFKPAIQSVTDAAHLDDKPLMRFIDAVDVEASNRASLLFELRSQNSRQFALYRVIAAHPDQIFLTGTTQ